MQRLRFALPVLLKEYPEAIISVDTFRSGIAQKCVQEYGVAMINDISGGEIDQEMFDVVADLNVPYILMHMKGTPQTMMEHTEYENFLQEIFLYFAGKIEKLRLMGVNDIILDPGFGFSKTTDQNYALLNSLEEFDIFQLPLLVGFSRKIMIRQVLESTSEESLNGTTALNTIALMKGAAILRVHDVKEAVQAVQLFNKTKTNLS
jgi:dihydropteroate synthase